MNKNQAPTRVLLAGIGGYGNVYVNAMLDAGAQHHAQLVGAADPAPRACQRLGALADAGIPILASLDEALATIPADLVVLSTPISLHAPQTCEALARGAHVLCEKPLCASTEDVRAMLAARARAGRQVAIGYQWSFSEAVLALKRDILAGRLGAPRRLKTIVQWPRDLAYYNRNRWAGRLRDDQGRWVLDSPVNNATAHYLHNMLFLLGERMDRSLQPATLTAELYRANAIETYDTAVLRLRSAGDVELFFAVSHAVETSVNPVCHFEFERATVSFGGDAGTRFVARFANGESKDYGSPEPTELKAWTTIACVRSGDPVPCGIEAASSHTACVLAAQQSSVVTAFPASQVRTSPRGESTLVHVDGLAEALQRCYDRMVLPSEIGVPWACPGRAVDLAPLFAEIVTPIDLPRCNAGTSRRGSVGRGS